MLFEELYEELTPGLKKLVNVIGPRPSYLGWEDLYQEGLLHLWQLWQAGEIDGNTRGYLLRSCYFHLKNFLRCQNSKLEISTFTVELGLTDFLMNKSDVSPNLAEKIENKLIAEAVLKNDLTSREKEVFRLLCEDLTMREIGKRLGISHVRVVKIRENIRRKVADQLVA